MEHVPNLLIASLLLGQIVFIAWITAVCRRKIRDIQRTFEEFVRPKGPEEASPLANCVDVGADMVARAVTARIKTSLMGSQSGQVRQEKAIEGAIAEDIVRAAHPLAGTLLDAMPELRKTLKKNPALLDFALSKLGAMQGQLPAGSNDPQQTLSTLIKTGGINGKEKA